MTKLMALRILKELGRKPRSDWDEDDCELYYWAMMVFTDPGVKRRNV